MMPRLPLLVLRRAILAMALTAVVFAAFLWPARHSLATFWPAPVEEWLVQAPGGPAEQLFRATGSDREPSGAIISKDRPLSMVAVETAPGQVVFAYLGGVRAGPDAPLQAGFPDFLRNSVVEDGDLQDLILVLIESGGRTTELPADRVRRLYRPNRMNLIERMTLTGKRVLAAWQRPFDADEDPAQPPEISRLPDSGTA